MWPRNALAERLNLRWPILQAPMGWLSTPALAAAVSNAGGLGGLGMWGFSAVDAERRIAGFRQQSGGSLNVNYPLWPEPEISAEVAEPMRKQLQVHYEAKELGPVPKPLRDEIAELVPGIGHGKGFAQLGYPVAGKEPPRPREKKAKRDRA